LKKVMIRYQILSNRERKAIMARSLALWCTATKTSSQSQKVQQKMQMMIEQHETDTSEQLGAQKTTLQQLHLQEMQAVELRYRETMANTVSLTREEERVLATEKRKEAVKEAVFTTRKETKSTVTAALTAQHALSMQLAVDDASTTSATQAALVARNEEKDRWEKTMLDTKKNFEWSKERGLENVRVTMEREKEQALKQKEAEVEERVTEQLTAHHHQQMNVVHVKIRIHSDLKANTQNHVIRMLLKNPTNDVENMLILIFL